MSLLRSSGLAHLARITAAILARRSGFLIPAMNLLRSSGSAQRALVSARFRSRVAGSAQYSLVAVRCLSFTLGRHIRSRAGLASEIDDTCPCFMRACSCVYLCHGSATASRCRANASYPPLASVCRGPPVSTVWFGVPVLDHRRRSMLAKTPRTICGARSANTAFMCCRA